MDYYSSTKNFLDQISKLEKCLCPRVYCYFDDIFTPNHWIDEYNGVNLAIREFNQANQNLKIGLAPDDIRDFKFPLGKNHLFMLHHFKHKDYKKYIGFDYLDNLTIGDNQIAGKIF